MTKTLYLPDNVAQKINEKRSAEKSEESPIDSAYVDATQKVLDPSLLDKSLLDRTPNLGAKRVTGFVLVGTLALVLKLRTVKFASLMTMK